MKVLAFLLLFPAWAASTLCAAPFADPASQNWPQWRGPDASGSASDANPPIEWNDSRNIKWKVEVPGAGSSTPIVWNERIYLMTAVKTDRVQEAAKQDAPPPQENEQRGRRSFGGGTAPTNYYQFMVLAFDRATGAEVWRKTVTEEVPHEAGHNTNSFASASPATDGERIYAYFGSRGLFCLDMDGNVLWSRDFGAMRTVASFGEGSSPAVHQGMLVVPWDHEGDSFIVALDAKSGEEKWKVARDEGTTWSTPLITEFANQTQVITNGKNRVRSYDLRNGELIWECGGQASNPIPSPVRFQDNVICMTGFRGYAIYSIPLDSRGDITDSDQITWKADDAAPYVPSPVLYAGQLYYTKANNGVLVSRSAKTGEVLIEETRLPGVSSVYASPVAAAGRIYLTARDGTTLVFKHGNEFELLATNKLTEGIDASPVPIGNELLLRGDKHLYCVATP